jgi:hypothetical protein
VGPETDRRMEQHVGNVRRSEDGGIDQVARLQAGTGMVHGDRSQTKKSTGQDSDLGAGGRLPSPAWLHIRLVHLPAVADSVPAGASGLGQQRREPLDPPVDRDVVDLDTPLGEQLLDISVGQAEAQIPADGEHDDVGWEAEAGKGRSRKRSWASAAASHTGSLAASTCSWAQPPQWHRWSAMRSAGPPLLMSPHYSPDQRILRLLGLSRTPVLGRTAVVERITSHASRKPRRDLAVQGPTPRRLPSLQWSVLGQGGAAERLNLGGGLEPVGLHTVQLGGGGARTEITIWRTR